MKKSRFCRRGCIIAKAFFFERENIAFLFYHSNGGAQLKERRFVGGSAHDCLGMFNCNVCINKWEGIKWASKKQLYKQPPRTGFVFVKKALLRKSDRREPRATLWPGTGPLLGTAPPTVGRVGWFGWWEQATGVGVKGEWCRTNIQ